MKYIVAVIVLGVLAAGLTVFFLVVDRRGEAAIGSLVMFTCVAFAVAWWKKDRDIS